MTRYWLVGLLLWCFSWGLATSVEFASAAQMTASPASDPHEAIDSDQNQHMKAQQVAPDTPVITINGLCENSLLDNTAASNCKTVITRAQFARLIEAVQPNMPARARRDFALRYVNALAMAKRAEEMGLDKEASYEEQMKLARIQILSSELKKAFQTKASEISYKDIEGYYNSHIARFEKAKMDRIYVPKRHQPPATSDRKLGDTDAQERFWELEQMKTEADIIRARAVAGEEFSKLQAEVYQAAGIKSTAPETGITIRRTSLPSNQASVVDLKPGEVSPVFADSNGYVIYKVKSKDTLHLDRARVEIAELLRSQRMQAEIRDIEDSATPTLDNNYFPLAEPDR
jgi:PPIC-type PPIASE domain